MDLFNQAIENVKQAEKLLSDASDILNYRIDVANFNTAEEDYDTFLNDVKDAQISCSNLASSMQDYAKTYAND